MSFSLSVSGHIDDAEVALQVDELVKTKGAELVAALAEFAVSGLHASFSGPSGSTDFTDAPEIKAAAPAEDTEVATDDETPPDVVSTE